MLAVPYKRYENATEPEYYNSTSTQIVYDYTTIVLPSTTLVMPTTATRELSILSGYMDAEGISTVTSYVTAYLTYTSGDLTYTVPVTVGSETVVAASTADACSAVTVTETVTETETVGADALTSATEDDLVYSTIYVTSTQVNSYPVEAEFTLSDITTTLTSFVEVTTTITSSSETVVSTKSASASASASIVPSPIAPGFNGTYFNSTSY